MSIEYTPIIYFSFPPYLIAILLKNVESPTSLIAPPLAICPRAYSRRLIFRSIIQVIGPSARPLEQAITSHSPYRSRRHSMPINAFLLLSPMAVTEAQGFRAPGIAQLATGQFMTTI